MPISSEILDVDDQKMNIRYSIIIDILVADYQEIREKFDYIEINPSL